MGQVDQSYNPVGLDGIEFLEYSSPADKPLEPLFKKLGFEKVGEHKNQKIDLYRQNDINFLMNKQAGSFGEDFHKLHGPSISSAGFRVKNAAEAFKTAVARGAKPYTGDRSKLIGDFPTIYGIGDSLVYFIDQYKTNTIYDSHFNVTNKNTITGKGFLRVDHMTNNVPVGEMQKWCDFYEKVFNFTERRYFDIRGTKTGLISKVMISPCGKIMIPINEPADQKSQIQEYINEYQGSGIQHVALLTTNVCQSVSSVRDEGVDFLDAPDAYFDMIPDRVPNVTEPIDRLKKLRILVDGDDHGYLLQIFTKNVIGPIFFEVIQRKGHDGFGDGNFQALFDAIERDQESRGVL
ncbi:MAG: 4-hydroxyphenylpyruvate dioxygenase [Bdellovibrionales bacterium]